MLTDIYGLSDDLIISPNFMHNTYTTHWIHEAHNNYKMYIPKHVHMNMDVDKLL